MNNRIETPVPRAVHASMDLQIPVHAPSHMVARTSKRTEYAVQLEAHGLRVHEWQLNVSPARVSSSIASEPSELPRQRSALDTFAKASFHSANAFETRVATLLMYNAARVKRM